MLRDLLEAVPFLAPIGAGVLLLWLLRPERDDAADQHDLSDYHEPDRELAEMKRRWLAGYERDRYRTLILPADRDILPPAAAGTSAPLYAETLFRTWHPDTADVVAGRMLREIAAVEQAKTADRDMTGAFPVVAVA